MVGLTDIPNEILEYIFTFVSDVSHHTIFNIILVNKHFGEIARPLRVRHWSDNGFHDTYYRLASCPPISHLALELLRHPELRPRVRSLNFTNFQNDMDFMSDRITLRPENLELLANAADEILPDFSRSSNLRTTMLGGWDDALAVLVIAWATKLTSLSISIPYFDPDPETGPEPGLQEEMLVLQYAKHLAQQFGGDRIEAAKSLPLRNLHYLDFRHWDTEGHVESEYMTPFLHLPNLKSLQAEMMGDEHGYFDTRLRAYVEDKYFMPTPTGTSSIESIVLRETNLTNNGISTLLRACRSLRAFHIDFAPVLYDEERDSQSLARGLLRHASTIEKLVILVDGNSEFRFNDDARDGRINLRDSYQHMKKLKRLTIPLEDLFDTSQVDGCEKKTFRIERVPTSTEYLKLISSRISWNWDLFLTEAQEFATGIVMLLKETGSSGRLCNLKILDLHEGLVDDPNFESIAMAKSMARANGVTLKLKIIPKFPHPLGESCASG
ncbi:hypothetical protein FHETE_9814 [Fusarium heterosporum]|uniref:F-box domain-containing protein n=1 Tax=Fusarium heterosporum TaxID=42747 RepID=A0A8H5WDL8_FUSHE|nr:hypothetical protein FHETE_9814 [Fusarium heterosporum]